MQQINRESSLNQLKVLSLKLTQTEEQLSAFWNMVPILLFIANKSGFFEKLNPEWTRVLGWTEYEMTSSPYKDFIHPDDLVKTAAIENRMDKKTIINFSNRYRCRDGNYKQLEWGASYYVDGEKTYGYARLVL